MHKILIAEPDNYPVEAKTLLSENFELEEDHISYKDLLLKVDRYYGLMIRLDLKIDAMILDKARCLRFIATPTTGEDHIDVDLAGSKGIKIISLKGEQGFLSNIYPTAEHAFALLFSVMRKIPFAFEDVKHGHWQKEPFISNELHGKTFGVIGLGRLGAMIVQYARAFGMSVLACDINVPASHGVEMVGLDDLCRRSDIISLHVNYSDENRNLINAEHFRLMKDGAVFINTSRGQLVNEADLLDALKTKPGFCAALDVLAHENDGALMNSSGLIAYARSASNLVITPHIGGYTRESIAKTRLFIAEKAVQFFSKKEMP